MMVARFEVNTAKRHMARLGMTAALGAAVNTAVFAVFLALDNRQVYFNSCLLISVFVVAMSVSLRHAVEKARLVYADCAAAFSVAYMVMVSMVYYIQIAVVVPGKVNTMFAGLVSDVPGTAFFYLDMFGYVMLCLATLFMALSVRPRTNRILRGLLFVHATILVPTYLLPYMPVSFAPSPSGHQSAGGVGILVGWSALFVPICLLMARYFHMTVRTPGNK